MWSNKIAYNRTIAYKIRIKFQTIYVYVMTNENITKNTVYPKFMKGFQNLFKFHRHSHEQIDVFVFIEEKKKTEKTRNY